MWNLRNETVSAGDTAISLYTPVPWTVLLEKFLFLGVWGEGGILGKLRTEVPKLSMWSSKSAGGGGVFLVSSEPKSLISSNSERGIPGKLRTEVPYSFMRSSNSRGGAGILGKVRTKVPKSSMRSSNSGGRGEYSLPRKGYSVWFW